MTIANSNVSESIRQYENTEKILAQERQSKERMLTFAMILIVMMLAVMTYLYLSSKLHKKQKEMEKLIADVESIRNDMQMKLEQERDKKGGKEDTNDLKSFSHIIREKYSEANSLCDTYYQNTNKAMSKRGLMIKAETMVHDFTDPESLKKIEEYVDANSGNLYSSFKNEMYGVNIDSKRLFLYLMIGFSNRSISVLLGQTTGSIYTKKSRLKKQILESLASRKEEYLHFFK